MTRQEKKEYNKIRRTRLINRNDLRTVRELGYKSRASMYARLALLDLKHQIKDTYDN